MCVFDPNDSYGAERDPLAIAKLLVMDWPIISAEPMSVGGDDGDKGDGGTECQQSSCRSITDDVQQKTDRDVDKPRHQ